MKQFYYFWVDYFCWLMFYAQETGPMLSIGNILPVIIMFSEQGGDLDLPLRVVVNDLPRNLPEKKENKHLYESE